MRLIYVVCEGKSEKAYLQLLNDHLREQDISLSFVVHPAGNGHFKQLKQAWKKFQKGEHCSNWRSARDCYCIWADWDLFHRNYKACRDLYDKERASLPQFCFNYHNFEDFLSLHLPTKTAHEWCATCNGRNHFTNPLHSGEYQPLFENLVPGYQKGRLPDGFNICEGLRNLRINMIDTKLLLNNNPTEFRFFTDFLLEILTPYWAEIFGEE